MNSPYRPRPIAGVLLTILVLSGCGLDSGRYQAAENETRSWKIAPDPLVRIGQTEGPEEYLFEDIRSAHLLNDGHILIADYGARVVRVFDGEGRFSHQFGGPGDGPGEFRSLRSTWLSRPDTLRVYDSQAMRVSSFLLDGTLLETVRIVPEEGHPDMLVGTLQDGGTIISWITTGLVFPLTGRIYPDTMHLGRFGPDGSYLGKIGVELGMHRYGDESGSGPTPFSPFPHAVVEHDTIFYTNGLDAEVKVRNSTGELVRTIPLPPTDIQAELAWTQLEKTLRDSSKTNLVRRLETIPRTDSIPHVAEMLMDDRGLIWVKRYDPSQDTRWTGGLEGAPGGEWSVVDRAGEVVAEVSIPEDLIPLEVRSDRVVGKTVDHLGVQRIAVHQILNRN